MNTFIAFAFLMVALLTEFGVFHFGVDTVAVKLFCIAISLIFILRADIKELKKG